MIDPGNNYQWLLIPQKEKQADNIWSSPPKKIEPEFNHICRFNYQFIGNTEE